MLRDFIRKKLILPITDLLKQGLSPEKLAMSLAVGIVTCCFPIIGLTTILCVIFAHILKLNHVAVQIANYFAYPLQIALIIPFLHAGNWIFNRPKMEFNFQDMMTHLQIDWMGFLQTYGAAGARACVAWAFFAPVAVAIIYFPLRLILRLTNLKFSKNVSD